MEAPMVLERIRDCIAEVLLVQDPATIQPDSRLIENLGADSLDFLDLVFRLEEIFEISISKEEVNFFSSIGLSADDVPPDGTLPDAALERLRRLMPEVPPEEIQPGLKVSEVPRLVRVQSFLNIVERKLKEKGDAAS
jgi:acyl carrier protein